jgi:DNA repair protein SbcC/Rad50
VTTSAQETRSYFDKLQSILTPALRNRHPHWQTIKDGYPLLVMMARNDVAAFAVILGDLRKSYDDAYSRFKKLYTEKRNEWRDRNLSFVLYRTDAVSEWDALCEEIETDVFFCRKFVLEWQDKESDLRTEAARLPFFPIDQKSIAGVGRRPPAKALLNAVGLSVRLADLIVNPGKRTSEGIVQDCLEGKFRRTDLNLESEVSSIEVVATVDMEKRLSGIEIENFRAYKGHHSFELDADVVVLYGPNGLGKTSFFDAVDFLCTGRIGRFENKDASAFRKISVNLDSDEDSAGVVGHIKHNGKITEFRRSVLKRNDIEGDSQEWDRKKFLSWLTNISPSETRAHVQYLQRIWRATHYFGQSYQELFNQFGETSQLPEEVVARMLAVQDYVDASKKLGDVCATLEGRLTQSTQLAKAIELEIQSLDKRLKEISGVEDKLKTTAGIRQLVTEIGARVNRLTGVEIKEEDEDSAVRSWRSIISGELGLARRRMQELETLRPKVALQRDAEMQARELSGVLENKRKDLQSLEEQVQRFDERVEANQAQLVEVRERESSLQDKQTAYKWLLIVKPEWSRLATTEAALSSGIKAVERAIGDIDEEISKLRETVADIGARTDEARRQVESERLREQAIGELAKSIDAWAQSIADLAQAQKNIARLRQEIKELTTQQQAAKLGRTEAVANLDSARQALEAAEKEQKNLVALLSDIEGKIDSAECPVCGIVHGSEKELRERVRERKNKRSGSLSYTLKVFEDAKSLATDRTEHLQNVEQVLVKKREDAKQIEELIAELGTRIQGFQTQAQRLKLPMDLEQLQPILANKLSLVSEFLVKSNETLRKLEEEKQSKDRTLTTSLDERERRGAELERQRRELENVLVRQKELMIEAAKKGVDLAMSEENIRAQLEISASQMAAIRKKSNQLGSDLESAQREKNGATDSVTKLRAEIHGAQTRLEQHKRSRAQIRRDLASLGLKEDATLDDMENLEKEVAGRLSHLEALHTELTNVEVAVDESRMTATASALKRDMAELNKKLTQNRAVFSEIQGWFKYFQMLKERVNRERVDAVQQYIKILGPMTSVIQNRLRGVYGFGDISLEPSGKSVWVNVEHKGQKVPPTDYFSDSQRQILMLSLFLSASITQTWSGFAPVLLDDPVTHLDGLNEYAFADLLRLIVEEKLLPRQFIVSTCDAQLYGLLLQKLGRLSASQIVVYEFLSIGDAGPVFRRRRAGKSH